MFHPDLCSTNLALSDDRHTVTKSGGDQRWDMALMPIGVTAEREGASVPATSSGPETSRGGAPRFSYKTGSLGGGERCV